MSQLAKLIPSLFLVLLTTACATQTYNPFRIDRDVFFEKTRAIALAPIDVQIIYEGQADEKQSQSNLRLEETRKKFESLMTAKLSEAGFSVIPSKEYGKIWDRLVKEQGGFFDPGTGKKDKAKYEATQKKSVKEISEKFPVNAVLYPSVVLVKVRFSGGVARWDGTGQLVTGSLESIDSLTGFLGATFGGGQNMYGTTSGMSFGVQIMDAQTESETFYNRGGIQLLLILKRLGAFRPMELTPIPIEELFSSEQRNAGAVSYALEPLIKKQSK